MGSPPWIASKFDTRSSDRFGLAQVLGIAGSASSQGGAWVGPSNRFVRLASACVNRGLG